MLVVDDDPLVARIIEIRLQRAGYDVRTAGSAGRGIEIVRTWIPHVCIVDKGLPGSDGTEFARQLRLNSATADTRTLLISGSFGPHEDFAPRAGAPFDAVLGKPFTGDQLLHQVRRLLSPAYAGA